MKKKPVKKATPKKKVKKVVKKTDVKPKMGTPTKFKKEYIEMAGVACKEMGANDKQLAALFKVTEQTINNWKKEFPDFFESIREGKDYFDTLNVEASLLKRSLGYEVEEITEEVSEVGGKKKLLRKKLKKQIAGDGACQIFYLKNRNPERWRDSKNIDLKSSDGSMSPKSFNDFYTDPEVMKNRKKQQKKKNK